MSNIYAMYKTAQLSSFGRFTKSLRNLFLTPEKLYTRLKRPVEDLKKLTPKQLADVRKGVGMMRSKALDELVRNPWTYGLGGGAALGAGGLAYGLGRSAGREDRPFFSRLFS